MVLGGAGASLFYWINRWFANAGLYMWFGINIGGLYISLDGGGVGEHDI
jgi:hypothetical protein